MKVGDDKVSVSGKEKCDAFIELKEQNASLRRQLGKQSKDRSVVKEEELTCNANFVARLNEAKEEELTDDSSSGCCPIERS